MNAEIFKGIRFLIGADLSYVCTNGFWIVFRYSIVAFLGLLLSIGFARLGSKELYGQYQFVLSLLMLFSVLSLPEFNIAALRAVALGHGIRSIRTAVRWSFLSSLLAIPILMSYGVYNYFILNDLSLDVLIALITGAVLFPFFHAPNTWYVAYEGKSIFKPVTLRVITSSLLVTLALYIGLYFDFGLAFLVSVYFGLTALLSWYFYFEVTRKSELHEQGKEGIGAPALDIRYGFSVTAQKFVFGLSESMPPLIFFYSLGFEFLAIFQIAYSFVGVVSSVIAALSALYLPKLFNFRATVMIRRNILWQNALAGVVSVIVLAILLRTVFFFFYGDEYHESYRLALFLTPLLLLTPMRIYLVNYFTAQARNMFAIVAHVSANVLGAVVFFWSSSIGTDQLLSSAAYMYTLTVVAVCIFLSAYLFTDSRKADSI